MTEFTIAASILSANLACLGTETTAILNAGANIIHFDVMDNHYVPNLTFGPMICEALRKYGITAPIDVHLMTKPVDNLIIDFAKAGANYISFHPEASEHIDRSLQLIRSLGCKAGLAFNPATPLDYLEYVLDKIDLILLMSVNPGFGGQQFIASSISKIKTVRQLLISNKLENIHLEVDGGIKQDNIRAIAAAGTDTFVVGSEIFAQKHKNYQTIITNLRTELAKSTK
jgi:ribulose-phosphate 3-epimerase